MICSWNKPLTDTINCIAVCLMTSSYWKTSCHHKEFVHPVTAFTKLLFVQTINVSQIPVIHTILLYQWMLYLSLFKIINFDFKLQVWMENGRKSNLIVPLGSHQTCILHCVASLKCYNYVFLIVLLFFRQTKLLRELMLTKRKKN